MLHRSEALKRCMGWGLFSLALATPAFAPPAFPAPSSAGRVEFEVLREGQPFGRQSVIVSEVAGEMNVETAANLEASFGPITLFRYQQTCRETWRGGMLKALACSTLKNGQRMRVEAGLIDAGFKVSGQKGETMFPAGVVPTTWWTRPPIAAYDMVNTETGSRLPVRVTSLGREMIDAGGARILAEHI